MNEREAAAAADIQRFLIAELAQRLDSTNNQLRTALSEVHRLREDAGAAGATAAQ